MIEARAHVLVQGGHSQGGIGFILILPAELFCATAAVDVGRNSNGSGGEQLPSESAASMLLCSGVKANRVSFGR
jgi:hypothetical protein